MAAMLKHILLAMLAVNPVNASPISHRALSAIETLENVDVQTRLRDKFEVGGSSSKDKILPRLESGEEEVGSYSLPPRFKTKKKKIQFIAIDAIPTPGVEYTMINETMITIQELIPKECLTKLGQEKAMQVVGAPVTIISRDLSFPIFGFVELELNYPSLQVVNVSDIKPDLIIVPLTLGCKPSTYNKFVNAVKLHISSAPIRMVNAYLNPKIATTAFLTKDEVLVPPPGTESSPLNNNGGTKRLKFKMLDPQEGHHGAAILAPASQSDVVPARNDDSHLLPRQDWNSIVYSPGTGDNLPAYPPGTGDNLPSYPKGTGDGLPFYPPPPGGYLVSRDYPAPPGGYPAPPGGYPKPPGGYPMPPGGYPMPEGGWPAPPEGYRVLPEAH